MPETSTPVLSLHFFRNPRGLQAGMAEGVALVMAQTEYDNDVCNKVETLKVQAIQHKISFFSIWRC